MGMLVAKWRGARLLLLGLGTAGEAAAQTGGDSPFTQAAAGMALRGIGPAVMGGRIADVAVSPADRSTWFVAVGSGGVWKTTNAGVTFEPVFDDQPSYSVGALALDPGNPDVVWVGTGENVSGRHVGWGDGVYRSRDGGASWERMGLAASQHIGRILVDPRDGNVVFVASEGPLWASGGERGVYKTTDGGESWRLVLGIDADTGVTDLEFDPSNPDVLYAAAYQRRRHVWGFMAGGPRSGIYKSTDGGEVWRRVERGLPAGDMGKIGLAVTPADPERVYATIEAGAEERGFYRSRDRGESWERRNPYISGGTGPHYYQEIYASPQDPDLVYQMDVFVQVTRDGGATFDNLGTGGEAHSDNHAWWIDPADGDHLLAGTDAGLYESFDEGLTWRHFPNLPVSQFYKVALGSEEPFYNVLGGAQDLGTLYGPSRTTNTEGVRNEDWTVPLGADGYGVAIDPTDPHILYMETQVGNLYRVDRRNWETLPIQPQPAPGEVPERWNWDSPVLISPHAPHRLNFGSYRLWKSEDRGDSCSAVSGDLTRGRNRYQLPFFGRVWSVDDLHDTGAMSQYATLTALSESPLAEGLLYTGSDDGLIHVSEDGGGSWRPAAPLPGAPEGYFVNDLEASQHGAGAVFAVADAHKLGDFTPYLFESTDRGRSWRSLAGDLPAGTIVWAIQQDHVNPDLLFLAAEFGLYFSPNHGRNWTLLGAGVPTIAFRDVKLQRRDGDVVGATFGRGFYVLDDYAPLREVAGGALEAEAHLFGVRDAWWFIPSRPGQAVGRPTWGSDAFVAPNPPFGATFTYWLKDAPGTAREERKRTEGELRRAGQDIPFPGWEALREETLESGPKVLLMVRDADGEAVRWVEGPARAGLHRVSWDLRRPAPDPIDLSPPGFAPPWATDPQGPLVAPGSYTVEMMMVTAQGVEALGERRTFQVKPVPTAPAGTDFQAVAAFQGEARELLRRVAGAGEEVGRVQERLRYMRAAFLETPGADPSLLARMDALHRTLDGIRFRLFGDAVRGRMNEPGMPSISGRLGAAQEHWGTRQEPTATMRREMGLAATEIATLERELATLVQDDLPRLEEELAAAGAPWTPGRKIGGGPGGIRVR